MTMRSAASPKARAPLLGKTAAELKAVKFKDTSERMMSLGDLCALVAGRVPLVIEVKSHFDGDRKLVARMAEVLAAYSGPAVGMSFDPGPGAWRCANWRRTSRAASSPSAHYDDDLLDEADTGSSAAA